MIAAIASLGDKVPIVLQHVEMIFVDNTLDFMLCPLFGGRHSEIDGLTFELFRLPTRREIGHHPVANFGIASVEGSGLSRETGLRPVHPESELETVFVRIVCYGRKTAQYGEANSLGPETAPILCKAFQDLVQGKK